MSVAQSGLILVYFGQRLLIFYIFVIVNKSNEKDKTNDDQ